MMRGNVYIVGLRYNHHARHSGYEAFGRYLGTTLPPVVAFRWTLGKWGWLFNQAFCRLTRHPWYSLGAHLTEWGTLWHMIRRKNCLYHVLYGDTDLWLLRRANRFTGNRQVASFHQPSSLLRKLGSIERVARHLDAVILVCEEQRAYFQEILPANKVFVIHHGVDTDFFRPPERPSEEPVCVTVGSHLRDFETHREAIRLVWKDNPRARFIAVGTRRERKFYFPELDDERIRFFEGVSDEELRQFHHRSKVAAFSFEEVTANNALLEAMACGLPIVATDVGGIREYVDPGSGILCPPKDPRSLADGILRLMDDGDIRERMAKASRSRALQLDFRLVADQMMRVYLTILRSSQ